MTVIAGIAFFADSRQILRAYSDPRIGNGKAPLLHPDRDTSLMRVLERIRQQLFDDKAEPFFIGEHPCPCLLVVQYDLLADEMSRIAAHRHPDHFVEICLPQHKVRGLRSETHIRKRHVHILLNRKQLL